MPDGRNLLCKSPSLPRPRGASEELGYPDGKGLALRAPMGLQCKCPILSGLWGCYTASNPSGRGLALQGPPPPTRCTSSITYKLVHRGRAQVVSWPAAHAMSAAQGDLLERVQERLHGTLGDDICQKVTLRSLSRAGDRPTIPHHHPPPHLNPPVVMRPLAGIFEFL